MIQMLFIIFFIGASRDLDHTARYISRVATVCNSMYLEYDSYYIGINHPTCEKINYVGIDE